MDLIGGGVLERFPELRVGIVEAHVAWLPGWLATIDGVWPRVSTGFSSSTGTGTLSMKPSEYFQRQCFIVAFPDDAWVEEVVHYVGEDNVMLCTDYPHPQTRETPQDTLLAHAPGLSDLARKKVLRENAMRVFGFVG
jgi:predicted TIM-barrel fold metal-dependent hydrolase